MFARSARTGMINIDAFLAVAMVFANMGSRNSIAFLVVAVVFANMGSRNSLANFAAGAVYVITESGRIDAQNARITFAPLREAQNMVVNILAHGL
jgi:hypothetical protein